MGKVLVNHKVVVPDDENYEFKYDIKSANQLCVGKFPNKLEYATYICENDLIIFTNSKEREVWSNREPKINVIDGKTIVTYD